MKKIAYIGDVHGCYEELHELLEKIGFFRDELDNVIFVGDLIDKGPFPRKVIELLYEHRDKFVIVKGNHEEKHLRYHRNELKNDFSVNRMIMTEDQLLARQELLGIIEFDAFDFISSWKDDFKTEDGHIVVHAGILPNKDVFSTPLKIKSRVRFIKNNGSMAHLEEITPDMKFWTDFYKGPSTVIFGHQPFTEPYIASHAIGIDTGCVHGNKLTAYLPHKEYTKFISVQSKKIYSKLKIKTKLDSLPERLYNDENH